MNEFIRIEIHDMADSSVQIVNARNLWAFVESKRQLSGWIKGRIILSVGEEMFGVIFCNLILHQGTSGPFYWVLITYSLKKFDSNLTDSSKYLRKSM